VGASGDPADHLRDRRAVLLLDNVEQVVEAAPWVAQLLEVCPGLTAVVTSREALRLRTEREYPLDALTETAAAEVFRDRVRAMQPGFDADPERVAEICRRLDGIPLAIELAAARVRVLGVDGLLRRLDSRLQLLTGGARDLPERQRTLQTTIAWSHDLLSDAERDLFARLAVFAGGWTLDAAEQVCGADLDTLTALVDRSLVRTADGRFSMFETIREFALARLADRSDADAVHGEHASYYMALARDAAPGLYGADQPARLEQLSTEYENLRSALAWCSAIPERAPAGLAIASDLGLYWFVRGLYQEGLRWLDPLLDATEAERTPERAGALWAAGLLATLFGDDAAAPARLGECAELAQAIGDYSRLARSRDVLGLLAFFGNQPQEARRLLEQSIALARQADDAWCLADALGTVASIYPLLGEFAAVRVTAHEALAIARRNDDLQGVRMALFAEALARYRLGDLAAARRDATDGLAICREIGDRWFVSYFLWLLSLEATARGDREHAGEFALEGLERARDLEAPLLLVCALEALAAVHRDAGDLEEAARLLDEADQLGGAVGVPGSYHSTVLTMRAGLAVTRGEAERAVGLAQRAIDRAREVDDPWAIARALTARAAAGSATAEADAWNALAGQVQLGDLLGAASTLDVLSGFAESPTSQRRAAAAATLRLRAGAADADTVESADEFAGIPLADIPAAVR
jgi:predicted ATPase